MLGMNDNDNDNDNALYHRDVNLVARLRIPYAIGICIHKVSIIYKCKWTQVRLNVNLCAWVRVASSFLPQLCRRT